MQFQRERIVDAWSEMTPLIRANHAETGVLDEREFAPDFDRYQHLEASGIARLFTIRDGMKLVGYAVFLVVPHLHYPDLQWALQDVLFVLPEHRGPRAIRFIRWTDEELKADGAHIVYRHVSKGRDYSRTLERLGYTAAETSFIRRLI